MVADSLPRQFSSKLCVSVDLDSIATHLRGYRIGDSQDVATIYQIALPRILETFDQLKIRATFFVVAGECLPFAHQIKELLSAGHEIASHSFSHRENFFDLADDKLQYELEESKRVLELISVGEVVQGFRAPSWSLSGRQLEALVKAGYKYDASLIPSWFPILMRKVIASKSLSVCHQTASSNRQPRERRADWQNVFASRNPVKIPFASGQLLRIPLATTPILRIPYYHTLSHVVPKWLFALEGELARFGAKCISYAFHAVDFLELEDVQDKRIATHPGMSEPLDRKLSGINSMLGSLLKRCHAVKLVELLEHASDA